jgi:heme A synthase
MAAIGITERTDRRPQRQFTWLQGLSIATVISAFLLVVIGGVVRVTESGLGCPDWPLCHGRLLPPWEYTAVIEYTHRFVASVVVGPLVVVTAVVAFRGYRNDRWVWWPAALTVPLLIIQALLGGVTVLTELPGGVVAVHLATAEALLGVCIFVMLASFRTPITRRVLTGAGGSERWAIAGALGIYAVILSGSLVTAMGATGACITWPLCQGQVFPVNHLSAIHMFHRYLVLALGILLLYAVWRCGAGAGTSTAVKWWAWATLFAFVAQVIIGAATVWLDFQPHWQALHLTAATAVWTAAAAMAILAYLSARTMTGGQSNHANNNVEATG